MSRETAFSAQCRYCVCQTFAEPDGWLITQELACDTDVRSTIADVAWTRLGVLSVDRDTQDVSRQPQHLVQRDLVATADVHGTAYGVASIGRKQVRLDDVGDI